jgi:hypothetical protein
MDAEVAAAVSTQQIGIRHSAFSTLAVGNLALGSRQAGAMSICKAYPESLVSEFAES